MKTEVEEKRAEIQNLQKALNKAKEKLEEMEREEIEQRQLPLRDIAVKAHECFCFWNHTDGCSWGYEEHSENCWNSYSHKSWLSKVEKVLGGERYVSVTKEDIECVLESISELKKKCPHWRFIMRGLESG
jgi:hypothetical protein